MTKSRNVSEARAAETDARRNRVLRIVLNKGDDGVRAKAISFELNVPESTIRRDLRALRDDGKVEPSHPSGAATNKWGPPGFAAVVSAVVEAVKAARKSRAKKSPPAPVSVFDRPSIHRIVPAAGTQIHGLGPSSVFDYGHWLAR